MNILDRLRRKPKQVRDPFGKTHRSITYVLTITEAWDHLSKERKREIIEWSKQNLWNDVLAYRILVNLRNGELKD